MLMGSYWAAGEGADEGVGWHGNGGGEEGIDLFLEAGEEGGAGGAFVEEADDSLLVDEDEGGVGVDGEGFGEVEGGFEGGVVDVHLIDDEAGVVFGGVGVHAEDDERLVFVLIGELADDGRCDHAIGAFFVPEVEEEDFSAEGGEGDGWAVDLGAGHAGGGGVEEGGLLEGFIDLVIRQIVDVA